MNTDALIEAHYRYATRLASRFCASLPRWHDHDAVLSDAGWGLVTAAHRFDPDRGVHFATFATPRVIGAIRDGLRQRDHMGSSRKRFGTAGELARHGEAALPPRSLHEVLAGGDYRADMLGHDDPGLADVEQKVLLDQVRRTMEVTLPARHAAVVRSMHFEHRTAREVAEELGVTETRVGQLRRSAIARLGHEMAEPATSPSAPDPDNARAATRPAPRRCRPRG